MLVERKINQFLLIHIETGLSNFSRSIGPILFGLGSVKVLGASVNL